MSLQARLAQLLAQIDASTRAAGRPAGSVRLIGVTKTRPTSELMQVVNLGLSDLGANYLEEALPGIAALKTAGQTCRWHFIGQVQSNKTRLICEHFDWLHTLDRMRIAERLSAQRAPTAAPLNVLLQVNFAREPSKGGVQTLEELRALAREVQRLPNLRLRGLMTIPPVDTQDPRAAFADVAAALAVLRRDAEAGATPPAAAGTPDVGRFGVEDLDTLSMGMSDDFDAAIAAGATMVRVGTALFGARPARMREPSAPSSTTPAAPTPRSDRESQP